jgi:peptide/nickel transport system substrate-binding protein
MKPRFYAIAVATAAVLSLVAACTSNKPDSKGSSSTSSSSGSSLAVSTKTPSAKGPISTITWDNPRGAPTSFDPARAFGSQNAPIVSNMCESLLRSTVDGVPGPGIAASFTHPDPLTYVFTLRTDVKFWNGTPVTPADVAFSLQRSATLATSAWKGTLAAFASATAADPSTVTVKLKAADESFPLVVSGGSGVVISKAFTQSAGATFGTTPSTLMCTGPFILSAYDPGALVTLKKNPNYWDSTQVPKVDTVNFKFITDNSTLTQALQSGEVDGSFILPYESLDQLGKSSVGKVYYGPPNTNGVMFNFHQEPGSPLADPRIRQAMFYAMDWDGVLKGIFDGAGQLLRAPAGPTSWSYSKSIFQAAYNALPAAKQDLTKAKDLVKQAGVPAKAITCLAPAEIQYFVELCEAWKSAADSIGLKGAVATVPLAQYGAIGQIANPQLRTNYDFEFVQLPLSLVDPLDIYLGEAAPKGQYNIMSYSNPTVTSLLAQAVQTGDNDTRAKLIVDAQKQIMTDMPWIPVIGAYQTLFMNNRITGAALNVAQWYPWMIGLGSAK